MKQEIADKIRQSFSTMAIYKDPDKINSVFTGRNLPSFVKDFLLKRYIDFDGNLNAAGLTRFLDLVIPKTPNEVKAKIQDGQELTLLCRFIIYIDLVKNVRRFSVPDMGIKLNEGQIPTYVYEKHRDTLVDGEKWGIIKLCLMPDADGKKNHVEMVDFKPFKPYSSVDVNYLADAR